MSSVQLSAHGQAWKHFESLDFTIEQSLHTRYVSPEGMQQQHQETYQSLFTRHTAIIKDDHYLQELIGRIRSDIETLPARIREIRRDDLHKTNEEEEPAPRSREHRVVPNPSHSSQGPPPITSVMVAPKACHPAQLIQQSPLLEIQAEVKLFETQAIELMAKKYADRVIDSQQHNSTGALNLLSTHSHLPKLVINLNSFAQPGQRLDINLIQSLFGAYLRADGKATGFILSKDHLPEGNSLKDLEALLAVVREAKMKSLHAETNRAVQQSRQLTSSPSSPDLPS